MGFAFAQYNKFVHVDTGSIAHIPTDEYPAPPCREADNISGVTVDDYLALIHGIATAILSIAVNRDFGPLHEGSQIIPRGVIDVYLHWFIEIGTDVPLSIHILKFYPLRSIGYYLS